MEAVDTYIPEPTRDVDKPFLMPIEDVFTITGRGTVVTGRIEQGRSRSATRSRSSASTTKVAEDGRHRRRDVPQDARLAQAGDNAGALLRGIKREEVERGQVLAKPGSITPHTQFKAEVYVLSKDEGGRHTPFFNGYRPQFYFRTTDVTGAIKLPEGQEMVMPGDNTNMTVELIQPIAMDEGLRFAIREGGRTVGAGVVTEDHSSNEGRRGTWHSRRSASGSRATTTSSSTSPRRRSSRRPSAPARRSPAPCRCPPRRTSTA